MDSVGFIAPETAAAAREEHERCHPTARELVREIAIAMGMDGDEYRDRVTDEVVETAQDALFGSLLRVRTGTADEFAGWLADAGYDESAVRVEGSEHVDGRAWHAAPATGEIAAVTYNEQVDAAVSTVRRQAYGRIYRELLYDGGSA